MQSSIVPLAVALAVALLLVPLRLSGLAAAGGFLSTVYLIGNFALDPLTATRKIVVVGASAAILGALADLAFKPTRLTGVALGGLGAALAAWTFWSVISQQPMPRALAVGAATCALAWWLVAAMLPLQGDTARAGAAGLGLGIGTGVCAILGASSLLGQYGLGLGAACGGVLLLGMMLGNRVAAGTNLVLFASLTTALLSAGAVLLAQLGWWSPLTLALIPLAVRLPLPGGAPWKRSIVASLYAAAPAGAAAALAYWIR